MQLVHSDSPSMCLSVAAVAAGLDSFPGLLEDPVKLRIYAHANVMSKCRQRYTKAWEFWPY